VPGFDGTGPLGQGPITGRGEGYCAIRLSEPGQPDFGYTGLQGMPVHPGTLVDGLGRGACFGRWPPPAVRQGRAFLRGRGRGSRHGRGWQFAQW